MFVRGGAVDPGNDYLFDAGHAGYYWPSISYNSSSAIPMVFDSSRINLSSYVYPKHAGFSVRCVALDG